ncbi:MAG: hypothetical protein R3B54_06880 [Bdellovibrionota bacterium]
MHTVEELVTVFLEGLKSGKWKSARIPKKDLPEFLILLARAGVKIGLDCLNEIDDPVLRSHVKNTIMACAGSALIGASVGFAITQNPAGAKVGAAVGTAVGLLAVATHVSISPDDDPAPGFVLLAAS